MISVIIPIYNAGEKIEKMLECVRNQTFSDFEVLLIDDGSYDKTSIICHKYSKEDSRFKYYYQRNCGVSSARNKGIQLAKGEYITFLDADDYIDDNYFYELFISIANNDLSVCDVIVESNGNVVNKFSVNSRVIDQTTALNYLLIRKNINSGPCAKLFKSKIVKSLEFPPLQAYEDILFVMAAFAESKMIGVTNKTAYHYLENLEGAMSKFKKLPSEDIVKASEFILDFLESRKYLDEKCKYITFSHLFQYVLIEVNKYQKNSIFTKQVQKLFRKKVIMISKTGSIPWKERIVFVLFSIGFVYNDKKIFWIGV